MSRIHISGDNEDIGIAPESYYSNKRPCYLVLLASILVVWMLIPSLSSVPGNWIVFPYVFLLLILCVSVFAELFFLRILESLWNVK